MTRIMYLFLRLADHDTIFSQTKCGLFAHMKKFAHLDIRQKWDQVTGKDEVAQISTKLHATVLTG